jgi:Na+/H+ antiporter NhaA
MSAILFLLLNYRSYLGNQDIRYDLQIFFSHFVGCLFTLFFVVLGIEFRALLMPDQCSTTQQHSQPVFSLF